MLWTEDRNTLAEESDGSCLIPWEGAMRMARWALWDIQVDDGVAGAGAETCNEAFGALTTCICDGLDL